MFPPYFLIPSPIPPPQAQNKVTSLKIMVVLKKNLKTFAPSPASTMFQEAEAQSNFSNLGSNKEMYFMSQPLSKEGIYVFSCFC